VRLSRRDRTDEAENFAGAHVEGHVVEGQESSKSLAEARR